MSFKKISVIGLGYIGLPTAAILASRGMLVIGVEINKEAVDTINAGKIHIVEPDLDIIVRSVVATGNLRASTQAEPAEVFLVAVPTPFIENSDNKKEPDLHFIESAAKMIAPVLEKGNLVILESTSPVGTTEKLANWLAKARPDLTFPQHHGDDADIKIAHCPERVLPGQILQELVSNDRLIGGMSKACSQLAVELYRIFVRGECVITSVRTAEMAKLTENSFRDVNIAFANELSMMCDQLHINVWELIRLANRHPRVNILNPGPGVGGHCIAVDPWFLVHTCPEHAKLIKQARLTNEYKPKHVLQQIIKAADAFKKPVIACLGLAFKADIDDLRESPALQIVQQLGEQKTAKLLAVEPHINKLPDNLRNLGIELVSLEKALEEANIVVILVDHTVFKRATKETHFATKVVIDTRGII
ncbi:UDP-N-acetyl-D-mannosamine dehydrogenase [Psychromonas sp. CNPT3]|uniref:UDP-N-acetyl-D-mannosamine dehydrogenase n=1 Tax=Psychromonas sp. CNPT3 TaxID=314282 RepID=UPI00006E9CAF|nr:UDP-N-acetyl-D-mannosamine dehydrogenase [Psychromonas sp. CNPT3]AGH80209.1 UDP-N-acetyl-D-mannosamine dehydrogenase [Psychromonas sp. CNPT3]